MALAFASNYVCCGIISDGITRERALYVFVEIYAFGNTSAQCFGSRGPFVAKDYNSLFVICVHKARSFVFDS